jgi:hypothetical protein
VWLVTATVLGVIVVLASVPVLMMSFMVFDAGETRAAWTIFATMWSVPIIMLGALVAAWIARAAGAVRTERVLLIVFALPLLFLIAICAAWLLGALPPHLG